MKSVFNIINETLKEFILEEHYLRTEKQHLIIYTDEFISKKLRRWILNSACFYGGATVVHYVKLDHKRGPIEPPPKRKTNGK